LAARIWIGSGGMIDVRVRHLSKHYGSRTRGERRLFGLTSRREKFWALRDLSFEVRRGEALGIVGPNGAGKSTLIKLLAGITAPSAGEIEITGRLASLVEVGAGFQPDLTGRENVFLNGAIMGMSYREITARLPSIIEFAEIGDALDAPVKQYSSGMYVRLGFAIAAQLDADILLLDEVLAVGDIAFQARCFNRIEELRHAGKTILLVSHDLAAMERVCGRAILLNHGGIVTEGDPHEVIEVYVTSTRMALRARQRDEPEGPVIVTGLTMGAIDDGAVRTGEPFRCGVSYLARTPLDGVLVRVSFNWPSGYLCTELVSDSNLRMEYGPGRVEFDCPVLTMQRGLYSVDLCIERRGEILERLPRAGLLRVGVGRIVLGDFYMTYSARVRDGSDAKIRVEKA
jgi:ABC-type polysaccharide/polyol phosphate transport system ATPase subunit